MKKLTLLLLLISLTTFSQVPSGFSIKQFTDFHNTPMDMEFHEDKMVVTERAGNFWLYKKVEDNWVREDEPLLDITNQVTTYFERGVQSIIIDEEYLYVYYTVEESYLFPELDLPISDNSATVNRVSKWQVDWSSNTILSTEIILVDGIPSLRGNHNGGGMALGDNNELYISTGDSANASFADEAVERGIITEEYANLTGRYRSQVKSQANGKILRVSSIDGSAIESNPYYDGTNSFLSMLYDYGYRNPFDISFSNEELFVADVGAGTREEITIAVIDGNAGWGKYEGFDEGNLSNNILNPDTNMPFEVVYNNPPVLDYGHNGNFITRLNDNNGGFFEDIDNPIEGNSITGGVVLKEGFGQYTGFYIFGDYTRGWLNLISPDRSYTENFSIQGTVNSTVDITQAPDGSLYIVRLFGGIDRISYEETLTTPGFIFNYEKVNKTYYDMLGRKVNIENSAVGTYIVKYEYKGRVKSEIFVKTY